MADNTVSVMHHQLVRIHLMTTDYRLMNFVIRCISFTVVESSLGIISRINRFLVLSFIVRFEALVDLLLKIVV